MSNRFKLKNGVLTLVNEKNEVVYESKPTPIKKSILDKTAEFIQKLPEIPTLSFLIPSPDPKPSEEETKDQPIKKEEDSTTEVKVDSPVVVNTSETAVVATEVTKATGAIETQPEQPNPDQTPENQSIQPEVNSEPIRTKAPETVEAKIEVKIG